MHGLIMVFGDHAGVVGFANWMVPPQTGAPDRRSHEQLESC
jgi:heme/copper-type cytochrome/quinol oxidase subunit 1